MDEKKAAGERTWYVCDPVKNKGCRKHTCAHNPDALFQACSRTSNPAFAVLDENGEPVKADAKPGSGRPAFRGTKRQDQPSGQSGAPCK